MKIPQAMATMWTLVNFVEETKLENDKETKEAIDYIWRYEGSTWNLVVAAAMFIGHFLEVNIAQTLGAGDEGGTEEEGAADQPVEES